MAVSVVEAGAPLVIFDASGQAPVAGAVTLSFKPASGLAAIFAMLPVAQRLMIAFADARVDNAGTPVRSTKITQERMMRPLAVIGNVNVDLIVGPVAPWPAAGTETVVDHDELRVGGQAETAASLGEARASTSEIAANVGDDQFGRWLREAFGNRAQKWPVRPEGTTLSVGMTHPDGERTFFTTRGHLPRFSLADVFAVLDGKRLQGGYALVVRFLPD